MAAPARTILHVDMDAFYAAIEQRDRPELRGRPVLVGGRGKRGVVTTASYEARPFGCRSAMPMGKALRLCPDAVVVPVRMEVYARVSRQVRAILERFSPDIEPVSIDEAFVDLTNVPMWSPRAVAAAREIKRMVREETRVTASVGIGPNKFLAKVASDMHKPDGLGVIEASRAQETLAPMPVGVLWGVGRVSGERLAKWGIRTVGDLLAFDERDLAREFGDAGAHWRRLALGLDDRQVASEHTSRSIGRERTFGDDIADPHRLRAILMDELEHAARSLRAEGLVCRRVALKLRRPDFRTSSRSSVLPGATDRTPRRAPRRRCGSSACGWKIWANARSRACSTTSRGRPARGRSTVWPTASRRSSARERSGGRDRWSLEGSGGRGMRGGGGRLVARRHEFQTGGPSRSLAKSRSPRSGRREDEEGGRVRRPRRTPGRAPPARSPRGRSRNSGTRPRVRGGGRAYRCARPQP
jgi:DNA polymerase-4